MPGDTFNLRLTALGRLATPIYPIMDNVRIFTHFFFTPNRILWEHWENFCGKEDTPGGETDFVIPTIKVTPMVGHLSDYFGLPLQTKPYRVSALPFRAHNLIYNEYFRDENLQPTQHVELGDGTDLISWYQLMRSRKVKDYFTSALPWPQKGTASYINDIGDLAVESTAEYPEKAQFNFQAPSGFNGHFRSGKTDWNVQFNHISHADEPLYHMTGVKADGLMVTSTLTGSVHTTVNALREAFAIQKILELDARGGTRYFEILRAHFGTYSPDSRLQRPEYLGGGVSRLDVTQVAQTSSTATASPQGNLSAFATAEINNHGFKKSFVEHGYVHGYMLIRPDLTYQQGVDRMWSRKTKYDFYWPSFAHLGEQTILNKEIFITGDKKLDKKVFGYQERWSEYKFKHSKILGYLRSGVKGSLDAWHLSQHFTSTPTLSEGFIQDNPPFTRVVAVPSQHHFIFDMYWKFITARPMPVYSTPGSNTTLCLMVHTYWLFFVCILMRLFNKPSYSHSYEK